MFKASAGKHNLQLRPAAAITVWCLAPINQMVRSWDGAIAIVIIGSVGQNFSALLSRLELPLSVFALKVERAT